MFKMKRLLFTLLMMCGIAYAQPGVDSTQTLPNPTPMTAKEYKFKYIQALNTISARSKFFGYDSAFFKNGIYTDITPPADDSSDLVPNTDWVMRQLAAYTPGGGGAEDTLILGRGIARDSLAPTKNRIYLDSSIYRVVQLNDSTLEFAHYDGRLDTVVVSGSGGGTGWGLSGNAITTGDFLGTTNGQKLMFKVNNAQSGLIDYSGNNVSLGYQSFLNNTSGSSNNAIGSLSLQSNTSGAFNNAMGHFSLYTNTSGALNTAIGNGAMYFNTTGSSNNAVGYQSLYANTTGIENNGFGVNSIRNNTTGQMNTAMGDSSLVTLTTGSRNTAIGTLADVATSSTDSSIAIGYEASAATKQVAFSPHVNTMFLNLDSASGTAPAIAGIDANGNWRKYATPSGGSPALTSTYVGVGNVSNVLSGSANFTEDGSILTYNGGGGVSIPNGGLSVAGGTISAIDYTGDWTGSVINPLYGGTGVNNGSNTITLGGNLTTSGAFASTFTMTAATGVTFPTTGTLATIAGSETFTNKTITSPTLSGTLIGSGTIGGSTVINTAGSITGFNIVATGLLRSAAGSVIEHNGRNKFAATSDGFETLTSSAGTANTANLSVGSLRTGYVAKTANYTATAFDETISCSTNAFTITLPTAVGCAGQKYNITNSTAANTIGISTTSSQTFANVVATPTSINLVGLGAVIVVSDGANWLQLK
jgi:hypothetical protein